MIAAITLLDILLTARTLLRRFRNPLLTRQLLRLLELAVGSILVLAARLSLMHDIMLSTMCALARHAPEFGYVGGLNLARLAVFGHTPPEIGDRFESGAHTKFVVPGDVLED